MKRSAARKTVLKRTWWQLFLWALSYFSQTCNFTKPRFFSFYSSRYILEAIKIFFRKVKVMSQGSRMLLLKTEPHHQAPGKYCRACGPTLGRGYTSACPWEFAAWVRSADVLDKVHSVVSDPASLGLQCVELLRVLLNADSWWQYPMETPQCGAVCPMETPQCGGLGQENRLLWASLGCKIHILVIKADLG